MFLSSHASAHLPPSPCSWSHVTRHLPLFYLLWNSLFLLIPCFLRHSPNSPVDFRSSAFLESSSRWFIVFHQCIRCSTLPKKRCHTVFLLLLLILKSLFRGFLLRKTFCCDLSNHLEKLCRHGVHSWPTKLPLVTATLSCLTTGWLLLRALFRCVLSQSTHTSSNQCHTNENRYFSTECTSTDTGNTDWEQEKQQIVRENTDRQHMHNWITKTRKKGICTWCDVCVVTPHNTNDNVTTKAQNTFNTAHMNTDTWVHSSRVG